MTLAGFRAWVLSKFRSNSTGEIDGDELQTALLEIANQLELQASWTPLISLVIDSGRVLVKITDWINGTGVKPATNVYWSTSGYTANIALATNIRGAEGAQGVPGTASASSYLSVSANNPTAGLLAQLTNAQPDSSTNNGALMGFTKVGLTAWQIGLPTGTVDAFIIRGFYGATFPEYLRIDVVGNVGIGTPAPEEKLHVMGNIKAAGWLNSQSSNPYIDITLNAGDNQGGNQNSNFGWLRFRSSIASPDRFSAIRGNTGEFSDSIGLSFLARWGGNLSEAARISPEGNMGIGTTTPTQKLDVSGLIKTKGLMTSGSLPTISAGPGVGGGTASIITNSTDMAGGVVLTTSGSPAANAVLCSVTFNVPYPRTPRILISANNEPAANGIQRIWATATTTGFTLNSGRVALDNGASFGITYFIID